MRLALIKIALTLIVAYALAYPFFTPGVQIGMLGELKMVGPLAGGGIAIAFLLMVFFYCRDLQRTLTLVRPSCRTATPKSVWLMFLLPYNFVEDFFIMANIASSLRQEALHRPALQRFKHFGLISGLGWCIAQIISLIPHEIGSIAGLLALPLWLYHWRFIRQINPLLSQAN